VVFTGYSYYKESEKILGNTFGMLVLQDFEAVTPNLLARTIETVEGGGLVVLLLKTMTSLKQLYSLTMVRAKFRLFRTMLTSSRTHMPATGRHPTTMSLPASMNVSSFPWVHATTASFLTTN
jgi:tRNA(Met) C34 N-acetyltransferase TmcA